MLGISSEPEPEATPPNLIACFDGEPGVEIGDAGGFVHAENEIVLRRHADVLKSIGVELDARFAEQLLQEQAADEMADGETVGPGDFVSVVGRNHAAGARHVLDDHDGIAGNMFSHVPGDSSRVSVVAAAGVKPTMKRMVLPS